MVIIIPTSGCLRRDCATIAEQTINIQYNREYFDFAKHKSKCNCIYIHNSNDRKDHMLKTSSKVRATDKKFNIYEIHNDFDPENPICVETFLRYGNIVIYINSAYTVTKIRNIIESRCRQIIEDLENLENCETIKMGSYNMYTQSDKYGMMYHSCTQKNRNSLKYSKFYDNIDRSVYDKGDWFHWIIYIIDTKYDIAKYLHMSVNRTSDSYNRLKNIKRKGNDNLADVFINGFNKSYSNFAEYNSILLAPNTIILDGVGLFPNKIVKQLDYPNISDFAISNKKLITRIIHFNCIFDINGLIADAYQIENNIKQRHIVSAIRYSNGFSEINKFISTVSWSHDKEKQPTQFSTITCYLKFIKECTFAGNLTRNYDEISELCKKHMIAINDGNIAYLNEPDNMCYITGVPLYEFFCEIQFVSHIKVNKKTDILVVICMQVSIFGMRSIVSCDYLYKAVDRRINIFSHPDILFAKNSYGTYKSYRPHDTAKPYNIIVKYSNLHKIDVINKIKSELEKKLLLTIELFGISLYNNHLYIFNPETNELFLGMDHRDISDKIIMTIQNNQNCILVPCMLHECI